MSTIDGESDFRVLVFRGKKSNYAARVIDARGVVGFGKSPKAAQDEASGILAREYREKGEGLRIEPAKKDLENYDKIMKGETVDDHRCVAASSTYRKKKQ